MFSDSSQESTLFFTNMSLENCFPSRNSNDNKDNNNNDSNDDDNEEETNESRSRKASLYSKLINIGLNDEDIGKAITQIKFKENEYVIKEGYLGKESKNIKKVRQRWMVLRGKHLYSYKEMQVYESPTEIFDLQLYRTCKMVKNGKITGEFELISIKSDTRSFIAPNKHEMKEWIRYIKKVILFCQDFNNNYKCKSIRSCLSLKRLQNVLKLYLYYNGYNDCYLQYIESYKQLINDYHH
eukprot:226228_1